MIFKQSLKLSILYVIRMMVWQVNLELKQQQQQQQHGFKVFAPLFTSYFQVNVLAPIQNDVKYCENWMKHLNVSFKLLQF